MKLNLLSPINSIRYFITPFYMCCMLFAATAQSIHISDPNFATAILNNCGSCIDINNNLTPNAASVTTLNVSYSDISDLSGIEGFTSLQDLKCNNNNLTFLPTLPNNLQYLYCYFNQLSDLPTLPSNLLYLFCSNNKFTFLPPMPDYLQILICDYNQLTTLPSLPDNLVTLYFSNNKFTTLTTLPSGLRLLSCWNNQITSLPTLPSGLQGLYCDNNPLKSLPNLPNTLSQITCTGNQLTTLPPLPSILDILYCHTNNLTCLPTLPNTLTQLRIDPDKITCLPNEVLGLTVYNANDPIPTPPVCTEPTACQCTKPSIQTHPQTTSICINQKATFTASANIGGTTPMTIKWQRNGVDITTSSPCLPGLSMAFTTPVLNNNDNGSYYQAVFTNACGNIATDKAYIKIDQYAKGGQAVLSNDVTALYAVICPTETKSLTTINSVGTIIRWQISKDNLIWSDISNSNLSLLVLNGMKSNLNVWYRAVLQSTYGVCTPPNAPVYSASFQVKFKKFCVANSNFADNSTSNSEFSAKAYPSIVTDNFTLEMQGITEGGVEIQFYNLSGSIVRSEKRNIEVGINQIPLNINDFTNGSYFVKIKAQDGNQALIKINKIE